MPLQLRYGCTEPRHEVYVDTIASVREQAPTTRAGWRFVRLNAIHNPRRGCLMDASVKTTGAASPTTAK
jgi:hypothetical protein